MAHLVFSIILMMLIIFEIGKFPSCAQAVDSLGFTPLHWALQNDHPSLQMVQELINAYPQAVQVSGTTLALP
jgi:ankyrin repeat protein